MKYLLLILFCLIFSFGVAQDVFVVDSLKQLLLKDIPDNQKVHIYIQLSNEESDIVKAESYAYSAVYVATKTAIDSIIVLSILNKADVLSKNHKNIKAANFLKGEARYYESKDNVKYVSDICDKQGDIQYRSHQYNKALEYYHKALRLRTEIKDSSRIIRSKMSIAFNYLKTGMIDSAKWYYLNSYKLCEEINDSIKMGAVLNTLGTIYQSKGIIDSAIFYYTEAIDLRIKKKQWSGAALSLNNVGAIYLELGYYDEAMRHFKRGLGYAIKSNSIEAEAYSYANLALIYSKKGNHKYALELIDIAVNQYELINKQHGIVMSYCTKGSIYNEAMQPESAIIYYKKAVAKAVEIGSRYRESELLPYLGRIYGRKLQYDTAEYYYKSSLKISLAENYRKITLINYKGLSNIAKRRGEDSTALSYYKKYSQLRKEIFNDNSFKEFSRMRAEYKNKYEQEEAILRDKLDRININNLTIAVIIIAVSLIIAILLLVYLSRSQKKLAESKAALAEQNENIKRQKNDLAQKENYLRDLNYQLYSKTVDLESNRKDLEVIVKKLETATDFRNRILSIIGHDLKGPIGTISKVLSLIMDKDLEKDERNTMLSLIQKSAVSAFNLLDNLLIWAQNEQSKIEYKPENILFITLLNESISLLQGTATDKNINIETFLEGDIEIYADSNMVSTVIRNLLNNAIKFSKKNSKIIITTKRLNKFAEISVKDNGIGISKANLYNILKQEVHFSSMGTEGEQGSGLGLQLCFEFIKKNKGAYEIKSEIGEGSEFIFTLPLENN